MKRVLSLLMAVLMVVSASSFVVMADDAAAGPAELTQQAGTYFEGDNALEPTALGATEQKVWEGDVSFSDTEGNAGITFVYKIEGAENPIDPGCWDMEYVWKADGTVDKISSGNWFYDSVWGGKTYRDMMQFDEDGVYYTYINCRMTPNSGRKFFGVKSMTIFKSVKSCTISNENANATFQMLAIIEDNLMPTVNFYGTEGEFLGSTTYQYTFGNKGIGEDVTKAHAQGLLKTPVEIAQTIEGIELPSKASDDQFRYDLIFKDEAGNKVDGVYKSMNLYADFEAVDNTIAEYKFVDVNGNMITSVTGKKGETAVFEGEAPVKAADADNTYTFKCWSVDGEEVDIATYTLTNDSTTFVPVFVSDAILKVTGAADIEGAAIGEKITVSFALNRTNLTTDVLASDVEAITGGKISAKFNTRFFEAEGAVDGAVELEFDSVAEDGTVNATLGLTVITELASVSDVTFTATAGSESVEGVTTTEAKVSVSTAGEREMLTDLGTYNYNEHVSLVTETYVPANKDGILTIIIEVNGLNGGTLRFGGVHIGANGIDSNNSGNMRSNTDIDADPTKHQMGVITEDGYYAIQIGASVPQWSSTTYNTISKVDVADPSSTRGGKMVFVPAEGDETSVPTITYHALHVGASSANITYMNGEDVLGTAEFTGPATGQWSVNCFAIPAVAEIYTGESAPVKESDIAEVEYVFDGWADAEGNAVSAVYDNANVFAAFEEIDNRTTYTVKFVNYDETVLQEETIPEGIVPEYKGFTPRKPSTDTKSYKFTGWDKEIVATPVTPEADGADGGEIVYTAQYEETDRVYTVIFYNEDGETQVAEVLDIEFGGKAETDVVPTKESDVQYDYTFEKWVAMDGSEVDLDNITSDLEVKAAYTSALRKYTVTYVDEDGETVLGTEEVEYGTGATAEGIEPTKEAIDWYTFEFATWVDAEGEENDLAVIEGDVTVYASYEAVFTHTFEDIDLERFYGEAVEYCLVNGIMNGTGDTTFSPNGTTTRGQLVTVLHRLEGAPAPAEDAEVIDFEDVEEGRYYTEAVAWASSVGVVKGITATTFEPDTPVTREQFATILYRYAGEVKGYYVEFGRASFDNFEDKKDISSYATKGIKWCIATEDDMYTQGTVGYAKTQYIKGIVEADGLTYMRPQNSATRGEMATILYRFITAEQLDSEGNPLE